MTRLAPPILPDILATWRDHILSTLAAHGHSSVAVGPKRPANIENLSEPFVRIMCLGGPVEAAGWLWHPRLAAESWHTDVTKARRLESLVAHATVSMEGLYVPPTDDATGFRVTYLELDLRGADQAIDGAPFVLTTTKPACVQVYRKESPRD